MFGIKKKLHVMVMASVLILIPSLASSVYDSFSDLQGQLGEAGYPVVMKFGAGEFSTKVFENGDSSAHSIEDYVNKDIRRRVRRATLDFVNANSGEIEYEAYKVADVFVCYMHLNRGRKIRRATFEMVKAKPSYKLAESFDFCLIIPAPIDEVERALARVRSSNSEPTEVETSSHR